MAPYKYNESINARGLRGTQLELVALSARFDVRPACGRVDEWCKEYDRDSMKVKVEDATDFFIYLYDKIQEAKRKREKCNVNSLSTLRGYQSAIQDKYLIGQDHDTPDVGTAKLASLLDNGQFRMAYDNARKLLLNMAVPLGVDPLKGNVADTYTVDEFVELASTLFVEAQDNHKLAFIHAAMTNMHQCMLRSDDLRLIKFCHLMKPNTLYGVHEPGDLPPFLVFANALCGNKVSKGGRKLVNYRARHVDYKMCAVSSLARMLFFRFTQTKEELPDPHKEYQKFLEANVWSTGAGDADAISYRALARGIAPVLDAAGLNISKCCHAFRSGGAQFADCLGLPIIEINRVGGWNVDPLLESYLSSCPQLAVKCMAGIPAASGSARYEQERLHFQVSKGYLEKLIPWLYPWVAKLEIQANKIKKKDQRDCPERVVLHLKALAHTLLTDIAYSTVVNPLESENDPILLYMMKQPEFATAFEDGVIKPLVNTLQHIRSNKQIKTYGISSQPLDCPSRPYREHSRGAAVLVEYKLPPVKELDPSDPSTLKEFSLPEDFFNGLSVKSAWDKYNKALLVGGVWMSMSELDALWEAQGMGKTWYSGLNSRRKEVSDLAGCITSYTKYMGVHKTEEESLAEFFKWTQDKGMVSLSQWNMRMRGSVKANVLASLAQGILPKDLPTQDDLKATKKRKLEDDVLKEDAHRETLIKIANVSCKSAMAVFYNEVFAAELDKAVAIGQEWNRQARNMLKEEGQDVVPWKKGRKRPTGTEMLNWDLPSSLS
eukprot:gene28091-31198_t